MSDMARTSSSEPTLPGQPSAVSGHPFTRGQLALFAGGSGDHNAIHIDRDVAKAKGFGDVIVPAMLVMAQLGKMLTDRSEEHTSELQSLMRISYAVFCLIKQLKHNNNNIQ